MNIIQAIEGLAPDAQTFLIACLFALACVMLVMVFLIISDGHKTENASKAIDLVIRLIRHLRKP